MRFKKGDKVEVMDSKKTPSSWNVAEILSGNGYTFCVQYYFVPGLKGTPLVESVSKKVIRPCPPHVGGTDNLVAGDVMEVFDGLSWKIAIVLKFLGGRKDKRKKYQDLFLVRLMSGNSKELIIHRSNIRMRQTWHDGNWILLEKNAIRWEDTTGSKTSTSNGYQRINFQTGAAFSEHAAFSSRSLKRISPYSSSIAETCNENTLKSRAFGRKDAKRKMADTPAFEKVDAVAYPREYLGEKSMRTSFNIMSYGNDNTKRAKLNNDMGCSGVRISESQSSESDACSVGSCSVTNQPGSYQLPHDIYCSDAEFCYSRKSCSLPSNKEVEISIRRLELQAYRCTLEALYASGPLSWEQEALLTNLRITLHVSNDEHLMELKHLISAKSLVN